MVRWGIYPSKRRAAGRPIAAAPSTACGGRNTASSAAPFPATTGSGEGGYGIVGFWIGGLGGLLGGSTPFYSNSTLILNFNIICGNG